MSTLYKSQMDTDRPDFKKRIFCVEYPGRVNNVGKMLATLGGLDSVGTAYASRNRRVELRFRPDDVYCKPACGDRHATIGLLIKVKVKKKIRDENMPCSSRDSEKLHSMTFVTSLVGVVDTIYKFENLCDFQYLPMDGTDRLESIYDRLLPSSAPSASWLSEDDVPFFLSPPVFSRFDTIHYYNSQKPARNDGTKRTKALQLQQSRKKTDAPQNTIGRTRRRRQGYAIFVSFTDSTIPTRANPEALKMLRIKFLNEAHFTNLKALFEERPVWSKNGILHRTSFTKDQLKYLLPTVAYYFVTGPWRVMWCRYGYDPRLNPESARYQTFDYRVRAVGGFKNKVKAKRSYSNYLLPYKSSPSSKPKVVIINRHAIARALNEAATSKTVSRDAPDENTCVFRPGYVPSTRQMFYQYCDVLVPEIQTMLDDVALENKCHSTYGFLPPGFDSRCREIVNSLVSAELKAQVQQEEPSANVLEDEENYSEEECDDDELSAEEIIDSDLEESLRSQDEGE